MLAAHQERVADVARQVRARPAGARLTIRKQTPTHSIRDQAYKSGLHAVDVSALHHVIEIDAARRLATVEGQVTIGALSEASLAQGLLPAVVPEYPMFTVSGLINGEGIQSSAHRYGVFTHTVRSVELVRADGDVITASRDAHPVVFAALPESLGTLGIVTAATIQLVPAKPFVKCTYRRYRSLGDYVAAFSASLEQPDFHEGIIFGPQGYVLATADFVDAAGGLPQFDPLRPGGEYYHQHVRAAANRRDVTEEVMPTLSYLRRLERGLWWQLESHADFPLLSETDWGRRHMDAQVDAMYQATGFASAGVTALERDRHQINQDMGVRLQDLQDGIAWVQANLRVYPLWNCAVRIPEDERATIGAPHVVDIGIYGEPGIDDYRHVRDMRALQQRVPFPSTWGVSYLTWDEIRAKNPQRFDRYERARAELNADAAFLHMKDKVVWIDPATPSPRASKWWRLDRSFGPRWRWNPLAYLVIAVAAVSKAVWRKPAISR
ncbi:MAG TPA: FAD-binding oxidoreductase [Vicinamibacterales bacterium]|nr:FAD-binding oxidoreductase [Vicinamibacterales bacterium]